MKKYLSSLVLAVIFRVIAVCNLSAQTGTWTQVVNPAPHANNGVCILMTDGTVICKNTSGTGNGTGWDRLTPDASGSYINGTWDSIASNAYDRLYFSSEVLPSGKVYVAGGEYGAGGTEGEVYDPVTNTWTTCGPIPSGWSIYDGNSEILYDGTVLEGPQIGSSSSSDNILYWSQATLNYTIGPNSLYSHDEAAWLKLPDSSILFVGIASDSSNRYIPQTGNWVDDGAVPVNLYDGGEESGCAFLLPTGNAIFFGALQYNAFYAPTGNTSPGTWTAAADFPTIEGTPMGQPDAPGAMMVNGHILLAVSPNASTSGEYADPIYFVEYDYTTNTFAQVTATIPYTGGDSIPGQTSYQAGMLDLPDGTVLVSVDQSSSYSTSYLIYTPGGTGPIPQGIPTINSILPDGCPNYIITGKLFNGISEGTCYGDDWQNATNYPLVRLSNGTNVYYAKTTNWNRIGAVQTDSLEDTAYFALGAIPAGTYSLVVVVNGFPSKPALFSIFGISSVTQTNANCSGGGGSATITTSGGITPYTYSWSDAGSQTSASATGLSAGTYTITVSDNNACIDTASVTITQSGNALNVTSTVISNTHCSIGGSDSASASGGIAPYTYQWSDGASQTTVIATGLSAGTYTITITDNSGCSGTASGVILQGGGTISITAIVTANANCSIGGSDSAAVSGGVTPYTYLWSDAATQTSITATGLSAGTYTVTVTDSAGCSGTAASAITQPVTFNLTLSVSTQVTCNGGSNGSDFVSVSGGTSPYTYLWNDANSQATATATGLSAGTYAVLVTDSNGCYGTISNTITQPTILTGTAGVTTNDNCNGGSSGSATANAAAGTSPYSYLWSDGTSQSTAVATGLSAGSYTVMMNDSCGASVTAAVIITQPVEMTISSNSTGSGCSGNNGSASVSASGGTVPYTYLWSDGGSQTSAIATGLSTGTYTVSVNDNCGATATTSIFITVVAPVSLSVSGTPSGCNINNGTASATASGGTSPYTYSWSDGGGTNANASGLSGGIYSITVTDSCGNPVTASVTITQSIVSITIASRVIQVCDGIGYITAHAATGGASPYTYSWAPSGGTNLETATNLGAGNYTITATDNNGCSGTASESITLPPQLLVAASITSNVSCNGGNNGVVTSVASGGTAPYTYSWFPGGGSNPTEGGLSAGSYMITVTDSNGCSVTAEVIITEPAGMVITHDSIDQNGICDGEAAVTVVSGGVAPYTYSWAGGQTTDTIKGLCAGNYCCTITGNNGCSQTTCIYITNATGIDNVAVGTEQISVYPNPNNGVFTLETAGLSGRSTVEIYNMLGQKIMNEELVKARNIIDLSTKPSGIYLFRVLKSDGNLAGDGKIIIQK